MKLVQIMWVFVFGYMGLALAKLLSNDLWLWLALAGFIFFFISENTPSEAIGWNKNPIETAVVFILVIGSYVILLLDHLYGFVLV